MKEGNEQKLARMKAARDAAMRSAERAAYAYFAECGPGPERTRAAAIHDGLYSAVCNADLFAETVDEVIS